MLLLLCVVSQRRDHVAQREQALVNVDALFECVASSSCLFSPLAASQIDKVKFGDCE